MGKSILKPSSSVSDGGVSHQIDNNILLDKFVPDLPKSKSKPSTSVCDGGLSHQTENTNLLEKFNEVSEDHLQSDSGTWIKSFLLAYRFSL